jgi:hypothetical protein
LLLYSDDYTRTTGTNELWFKDTGDCDATLDSQRVYDVPALDGNAVAENAPKIV